MLDLLNLNFRILEYLFSIDFIFYNYLPTIHHNSSTNRRTEVYETKAMDFQTFQSSLGLPADWFSLLSIFIIMPDIGLSQITFADI